MWVGGERHAPAALIAGSDNGTHCKGDWVEPRADLEGHGKGKTRVLIANHPPRRYTYCSIPALHVSATECLILLEK